MTKYAVWSTIVGEDRDAPTRDQLEVTRTDPRVANDDRQLIAEILHRKCWVQEVA